jgi:eukaryotic-like serine/threonine-protein kinase
VNSSPVVSEGTVYIGSNDRHVYALDAQSGSLIWKQRLKGPVVSAPAVHGDLVFVAGGSGDGTLYALQKADGTPFWSFTTGGKLEADPVSFHDQVFVSGADQRLYAFKVNRTRPE